MNVFFFVGNYDDENGSYIAVQHDHIAYRMFEEKTKESIIN